METPNYYAVIPANVRYAKINANAKLLYGEITALCTKEGYCWATNTYFANLYDVHKDTISTWITELVKHGFIMLDIHKSNGNKRKIYLSVKSPIPMGENTDTPIGENTPTLNNTSNSITKEKPIQKIIEECKTRGIDNKILNRVLLTLARVEYTPPKGETLDTLIARLKESVGQRDKKFLLTFDKRMMEFETYWIEEIKKKKNKPNWKAKLLYNFNNFHYDN